MESIVAAAHPQGIAPRLPLRPTLLFRNWLLRSSGGALWVESMDVESIYRESEQRGSPTPRPANCRIHMKL